MPPPPPPSKSYSLVLDTDSEEDQDDVEYRRTESDTAGVAGSEATNEGERPRALPNAALLETLKRMRSTSLSDYDVDSTCGGSPRGSPRSSANFEDPRAAAVAAAVAARRAEIEAAANAAADEAAAELEKEELEEEAEAAARQSNKKKSKKKNRAKNKRRRKGSRTVPLDDDEAKEDEHRIRSGDDAMEDSNVGKNVGENGTILAGNMESDVKQEDINEDMKLTEATIKATENQDDDEGSVANEDEHRIRSSSGRSNSPAEEADMDETDEEEKKSEDEDAAVGKNSFSVVAETESDALRIPRPAGSGNASSSSVFSKITNFVLGTPTPAENEEEENHNDDENGDDADGCDEDGDAAMPDAAEEATIEDVSGGKKKKCRKKKKKKKSPSGSASTSKSSAVATTVPSSPSSMRSAEEKHSVTFGPVSVREYRRAMGECVVPADGGWPLGLSDELIHEYDVKGGADGFEERKQTELRRRHEEVLIDRLKKEWKRRKREMEREKEKHEKKSRRKQNQGQRGGGGGRTRKGSKTFKDSPDASGGKKQKHEEPPPKELLDAARMAAPAQGVYLETRQFDYRRRKDPSISNSKKGGGRHRSHSAGGSTDGAIELPTVEDVDDGKNPLFAASAEEERMHKIVHDREAIHADTDDDGSDAMNRGASETAAASATCDGGYDHVEANHVKHELESIRSSRTGEGSTGCTCRKIHVFLPGRPEGKGHRRGSHRRMPERKVREELRRRGLLPDAGAKGGSGRAAGRDELERLLHDAVEAEPCCWGGDCPCVRNGIGCQADTCSCWHPNHGADAHHSKHHHAPTTAELNEVLEDVEGVKRRCGNANGMYVVDFARIEQGRRKFLTKNRKGDVAISEEQEEKNTGKEPAAETMLCQPVGNGSP